MARDYVEFPSQLLEHWLSTPEVLNRFALHVETGKPIPRGAGGEDRARRELQPGLQDRRVPGERAGRHEAAPRGREARRPGHVRARDAGRARHAVGDRDAAPHAAVQHVFAGDGYSAGYYSYLWSDTLTADAWEAFTEANGAWDKAVAKRLRDNVFSVGNTVDPADGYRAFRGRDPGIAALMRKRGFPVPGSASAATPAERHRPLSRCGESRSLLRSFPPALFGETDLVEDEGIVLGALAQLPEAAGAAAMPGFHLDAKV